MTLYISPTQLEMISRCGARWFARYKLGKKTPPSDAMEWGTTFHKKAEDWFLHQRPPDASTPQAIQLMKTLHHLLSPIKDGPPLVEQKFEIEYVPGVYLIGYIDLMWPDKLLADYKTTKDLKYAKSEKELRTNIQAIVYAWAAVQKGWFGEGGVRQSWVYIPRDTSKSPRPTKWWWSKEEIESAFRVIVEPLLKQAIEAHELLTKMAQAEHNLDACWDFGGCRFAQWCHKDKKQTKKGYGDLGMGKGIFSKMKKVSEGEVPPVNPPEAEVVPEKAEPDPEPEKPAKKKAPAKKAPAKKAPAKKAPAKKEEAGFDLYVDCYPVKGAAEPVQLLSDLIKPQMEAVAAQAEVPFWSLAEYGSGSGGLATEVSQVIGSWSGSVVASSYCNEGKALLVILEQAARKVVK